MGTSQQISMELELSLLITRVGLNDLTSPFETEEMYKIVKFMPPDRAPEPDGFNGLLLKKFWHLIKEFYKLSQDFYDEK